MRKMRRTYFDDSETDSLSDTETEDDSGEKTGAKVGVDEVSQPGEDDPLPRRARKRARD